jgi:hypothetical protein
MKKITILGGYEEADEGWKKCMLFTWGDHKMQPEQVTSEDSSKDLIEKASCKRLLEEIVPNRYNSKCKCSEMKDSWYKVQPMVFTCKV